MLDDPGCIEGDLAAAGPSSDMFLDLFGRGEGAIGLTRCVLNGSSTGVPTTPGDPSTNIGVSGSAGASCTAVLSVA